MTRVKRTARKNTRKAATQARRERWRAALSRTAAVVAAAVVVPLTAVGCIAVHDLVTQGSFYRIRQLTVSGNARLSREAVLRQAAIPAALNLLGVNIRVVRERLLAHPWIAEASVARHFPDRLTLHIREESAAVQLALADRWYMANAAGAVFAASKTPEPGVPVVTGVAVTDLDDRGRLPEALWQTVAAAKTHFDAGGPHAPAAALTAIAYDPDIGMKIRAAPWLGVIHVGIPPTEGAFQLAEDIAATHHRRPRCGHHQDLRGGGRGRRRRRQHHRHRHPPLHRASQRGGGQHRIHGGKPSKKRWKKPN
jgi:hypothetical protein